MYVVELEDVRLNADRSVPLVMHGCLVNQADKKAVMKLANFLKKYPTFSTLRPVGKNEAWQELDFLQLKPSFWLCS